MAGIKTKLKNLKGTASMAWPVGLGKGGTVLPKPKKLRYYAGVKAGSDIVRIQEKGTDRTLAVSYNLQDANLIIKALNAYE